MILLSQSGVSEAAKTIRRVEKDISRRNDEAVTFSNFPLDDQLIDVFNQCSEPGWEGEGSMAIERSTLSIARTLVESLPRDYRTPTICGEPDGHVNLEWYVSPRRILTVSVNPIGTLHWAALIGDEDPRGSCRYYGGDTPKTLLHCISRVCNA